MLQDKRGGILDILFLASRNSQMKKMIMPLTMVSVLMSGSALAAIGDNGQANNNDASQAELHFTGKLTSSLCQVATSDVKKEIYLGELSQAALTQGRGRGPSQSFSVSLVNCDPQVTTIKYSLQDKNGSKGDYLVNQSGDTMAKGVGVYIEDNLNQPLQVDGAENTVTVQNNGTGALPNQVIPLAAYIGSTSGKVDDVGTVTMGLVDASAVMTIRAAQ
ncbi:putative CS12 fimbria-like major fimbrial protein subunit [Escherichia coli 536]|uniref:Putative CS12 fimbria-like major fimbrial protein subunit n=1 Tax=Escherichia coli O6:K15:H31 (strain 536 / UPEC) TaxID=362663 RepID=A0A454A9E2_ECOL5|nr:putative CS12 fimbria-like major fimbrial protein subunit [Escherichia coli 536]